MTGLILIFILTTSPDTREGTKAQNTEPQDHASKQSNNHEHPDEALLLFLAEWSDESDQWLDPQLLNSDDFIQPQAETDDERFPDRP